MNPNLSFIERVTLFIASMHKSRADELLEGFVEPKRYTAQQFYRHVGRWSSATRQARLAREFGVQPQAIERLQALISNSPPRLRAAISETLPEQWRSAFPRLRSVPAVAPSLALRSRARRLVHETV